MTQFRFVTVRHFSEREVKMARVLRTTNRLSILCKSLLPSSLLRKQEIDSTQYLLQCIYDARPQSVAVAGVTEPNLDVSWNFAKNYFANFCVGAWRKQIVTPFAQLHLKSYTSGRVYTVNDAICFQVGGADGLKMLCDDIRSVAENEQIRHFDIDEVCQLKRDQMVLCSESLNNLIEGETELAFDLDAFGVPGALYRGRLVEGAEKFKLSRGGGRSSALKINRLNALAVELVDVGMCGLVSIESILPMPKKIAKKPAKAIIIGCVRNSRIFYENNEDDYMFQMCNAYSMDADFKPHFFYPEDERTPRHNGYSSASSVQRIDGYLKFKMPDDVSDVPQNIAEFINKSKPFFTKADIM